jgi:hypothetical protein
MTPRHRPRRPHKIIGWVMAIFGVAVMFYGASWEAFSPPGWDTVIGAGLLLLGFGIIGYGRWVMLPALLVAMLLIPAIALGAPATAVFNHTGTAVAAGGS